MEHNPKKQSFLGKSLYLPLEVPPNKPVQRVEPLILALPLTTKYGYDPPCPVQYAMLDFLAVLVAGIKLFIASHLSYRSQLVPICLLGNTLKVAQSNPWIAVAENY